MEPVVGLHYPYVLFQLGIFYDIMFYLYEIYSSFFRKKGEEERGKGGKGGKEERGKGGKGQ